MPLDLARDMTLIRLDIYCRGQRNKADPAPFDLALPNPGDVTFIGLDILLQGGSGIRLIRCRSILHIPA